jgi:hypothetical protein
MSCLLVAGPSTIRVTLLDGCGAPVVGDENAFVASCFTSIAMNSDTDTVDDTIYRDGTGSVCAIKRGCTTLLGYTVEANLNGVTPGLVSLMTGNPVVAGTDGEAIGYDDCAIQCNHGFALEVWNEVIGDACADGEVTYMYTLLPWVTGGYVTDLELGTDALAFQVTGTTRAGGNWGVGPWNVQGDPAAPMLTPLGASCHRRIMSTNVAPPEASCDPVEVPAPTGGGEGLVANTFAKTTGGTKTADVKEPATSAA